MIYIDPQSLAALMAEAYDDGYKDGKARCSKADAESIFLHYEEICEGLASEETRH